MIVAKTKCMKLGSDINSQWIRQMWWSYMQKNHYNAAVKSERVLVKGFDYALDSKEDDTSDDEDYVSNPFQKGWSTYDEPKHRLEQKLVSIPEEIYKYLVTLSRVKIGIPLTNTAGPTCPACPP